MWYITLWFAGRWSGAGLQGMCPGSGGAGLQAMCPGSGGAGLQVMCPGSVMLLDGVPHAATICIILSS